MYIAFILIKISIFVLIFISYFTFFQNFCIFFSDVFIFLFLYVSSFFRCICTCHHEIIWQRLIIVFLFIFSVIILVCSGLFIFLILWSSIILFLFHLWLFLFHFILFYFISPKRHRRNFGTFSRNFRKKNEIICSSKMESKKRSYSGQRYGCSSALFG